MVGALNLISVAFAVLFIGLGVDFGIQFSVRYRAERHEVDDLHQVAAQHGRYVGAPLTLAAAATAAGFLSFLPTDYKGLSELGLLAGLGMIIAFITSITLIPALLTVLRPPGEPAEMGYKALAPVDRFMERHRIPIIVGTGLVVAAGLPLLYWLQFDFNPLNLRSPKVEVGCNLPGFAERSRDRRELDLCAGAEPGRGARRRSEARRAAGGLERKDGRELHSRRPAAEARRHSPARDRARSGAAAGPPQEAADRCRQRRRTQGRGRQPETGRRHANRGGRHRRQTACRRLLPGSSRATKPCVPARHAAMVPPLDVALDELRNYLEAQPVTLETLPAKIASGWVTQDGRFKVEILPKGDPNDNETLRKFARAVQQVEPNAIGGPISILESGRTVIRAFFEAGFWALASITILLWIVLRRFGDVLLTLIPLILAGVVTMELMVILGMKLNFANIIALPLLLGLGVAFKIYYIMAWRAGQTDLLQSSLTRAVFFSALTTATAFGSLWLSSHPGTSSMGKLMALALVTTMAAAVLFQPVLMGRPREREQA